MPTPYLATAADTPLLQLIFAARRAEQLLGEILRPFALGLRDWIVLDMIVRLDVAAQTRIAAHTGLDKVAVNRACALLHERELLARCRNEADGRSHLLRPTAAGLRLAETASAAIAERESLLMPRLSSFEIAAIGCLSGRVDTSAARLGCGRIAPARMPSEPRSAPPAPVARHFHAAAEN